MPDEIVHTQVNAEHLFDNDSEPHYYFCSSMVLRLGGSISPDEVNIEQGCS